MIKVRKYRNRGVKNFHFDINYKRLVGIYLYLSRPKISQCMSMVECDVMVANFCKLHKYEDDKINSFIFANNNWEEFEAFVKSKNRNNV